MENRRCKTLVFPRQTRNMASIVGGTFKTLLHTHTHARTHTHTHIHHQSSYPFDFELLSQMVQSSWVFSCSWALLMIDWKCCLKVLFSTCKTLTSHMHHKHVGAQTVCLYLEMSLMVSPKRRWCLVCPFQQCRLLALLLTHDSVRYVKWRYHTNH
jgi:hypothetical protein